MDKYNSLNTCLKPLWREYKLSWKTNNTINNIRYNKAVWLTFNSWTRRTEPSWPIWDSVNRRPWWVGASWELPFTWRRSSSRAATTAAWMFTPSVFCSGMSAPETWSCRAHSNNVPTRTSCGRMSRKVCRKIDGKFIILFFSENKIIGYDFRSYPSYMSMTKVGKIYSQYSDLWKSIICTFYPRFYGITRVAVLVIFFV